jgi:hypothetical protein
MILVAKTRILLTGSRDWAYPLIVEAYLDQLTQVQLALGKEMLLVHGDCPTGADAQAQTWADRHGVQTERHPASEHGEWPVCGPRRNAYMVSLGATQAVGFIGSCSRPACRDPYAHGSHGATGCLRLAKDARILTMVIRAEYL